MKPAIVEQEVVLYRTSTGAVAALEDAYPHRLTPLSMGRLKDDAIECGYHGMTFEPPYRMDMAS